MPIVVPPKGTRGVNARIPGGALGRLSTRLMAFLSRRGMKVQDRPLLELITLGARSGSERHTVLGWFEDPNDPAARLVVASFAGSASNPAWLLNMAAHPGSVRVRDERGEFPVTADTLVGAERAEAWERVAAAAPGYGAYLTKTDREIPIVRLTPRR
jgi:deazaflavin-dependent oxidoreductase (nitroreductase family)